MSKSERVVEQRVEQEPNIENTGVVIVAAGNGFRLENHGVNTPKAFIDLAGKVMCVRALEPFIEMGFKNVVLVVPDKWTERADEIISNQGFNAPVKIITGGATRFNSMIVGIEALDDAEWVLGHDGDRPFETVNDIKNVLHAPKEFLAVVPGAPVPDTIRLRHGNKSLGTIDRDNSVKVQTPQRLHLPTLRRILKSISPETLKDITDEAKLFELMGLDVGIVDGNPDNFKITFGIELVTAEVVASTKVVFKAQEGA